MQPNEDRIIKSWDNRYSCLAGFSFTIILAHIFELWKYDNWLLPGIGDLVLICLNSVIFIPTLARVNFYQDYITWYSLIFAWKKRKIVHYSDIDRIEIIPSLSRYRRMTIVFYLKNGEIRRLGPFTLDENGLKKLIMELPFTVTERKID